MSATLTIVWTKTADQILDSRLAATANESIGRDARVSVNRRHYRTRISRILLYPFCALGVLAGLVVTVVPRGPLLLHLVTGLCVAGAFWLTSRVRRLGVAVTVTDVIVYNTYYTRRHNWNEVADFDTRRWAINQEVGLRLVDGRRVRTSLLQGRTVIWSGGKTQDILEVLRSELRARHHSLKRDA